MQLEEVAQIRSVDHQYCQVSLSVGCSAGNIADIDMLDIPTYHCRNQLMSQSEALFADMF
jgi:hypothetical protein